MNKDWKELTIARYRCIPYAYKLCIGNRCLSCSQAINEVELETDIGKVLVEIEREYFKAIKNGEFFTYCN